jgi:hypothetical protein
LIIGEHTPEKGGVVSRVFELKDSVITEYVGGHSDYAAKAGANSLGAKQARA